MRAQSQYTEPRRCWQNPQQTPLHCTHLLTWAVPTRKISAPLLRFRRKVDVLERTAVEPLPPLPSALLLNCRRRAALHGPWVGNTVLAAQPLWQACGAQDGRVGEQEQVMEAQARVSMAVAVRGGGGSAGRKCKPGIVLACDTRSPCTVLTPASTEPCRCRAAFAAAPPSTERRAAIAAATEADARSIWSGAGAKQQRTFLQRSELPISWRQGVIECRDELRQCPKPRSAPQDCCGQ